MWPNPSLRVGMFLLAMAGEALARPPSPSTPPFIWPPASIAPFAEAAPAGEGVFAAVGDAVVTSDADTAPPILKASLQTSRRGTKSMAYVVAWDPRRVELRMQAGARNPVPPRGPRGDGRIPRVTAVTERLLGAFNGGFLTEDVTSCDGMTVDGRELTPVTAKGGTVALLRDGRTAFGTWPKDTAVPGNIVSLRQNMVPFIEDGKVDPYARKRWGGTFEVTYAVGDKTVRTAMCSVKGGAVLFFYLSFADPALLGEVLLRAGCDYAIHLDMNPGHTTFEFYRALGKDAPPTDPKGLRDLGGTRIEATPLVEKLRKSGFPRYLDRASSDFFYLLLRDPKTTVPAPPVVPLFPRPE